MAGAGADGAAGAGADGAATAADGAATGAVVGGGTATGDGPATAGVGTAATGTARTSAAVGCTARPAGSGVTPGSGAGSAGCASSRRPPSTFGRNFTRTPSTSRIAVRSTSLTPAPPGAARRKSSTSVRLTKDSVSTSPSSAIGWAVYTTAQALRFARCTVSSTSGQASRTCLVVAAPTTGGRASATRGIGATTGDADRSGADEGRRSAEGGGTSNAGGGTTATGGLCGAGAVSTPTRRSSRSIRVAAPPAPAAGTSIRAVISSRCRRGDVAPTISSSASLTVSATRESSAAPNRCACRVSAAIWSAGAPRSTPAARSPVAATTIRSRIRSSRSSTNRRGSWPVCTIRSIAANAPAASCSATAVTTSSIREALV